MRYITAKMALCLVVGLEREIRLLGEGLVTLFGSGHWGTLIIEITTDGGMTFGVAVCADNICPAI